MKKEIDQAYDKAIEILKECSTKRGLYASGGKDGYKGVWSRDSMISLIGASVEKQKFIQEQFKKSLITLGKHQSKKGQVPNAVLKFERKNPQVDYLSIDSSLWFIIGHYIYMRVYKDKSLFKRYENKIDNAVKWLSYQDMGEDLMLEQLPTTDWQDAFPHKYGRAINTQVLYYKVLKLRKDKNYKKLKKRVNFDEKSKLWGGEFYYAYRWKNHRDYKEIGEWFDSLANLLAIIFDFSTKKQSLKILSYIKEKKINKPYPVKAIFPPIKKSSKYWQDYFKDCDAGKPYSYLNAGIWPYIGGFYVLALIKLKKFKEAEKELKQLAKVNLEGNFPEWIHPQKKKPFGKLQAWNAGVYMLAYQSLKKKKVLIL